MPEKKRTTTTLAPVSSDRDWRGTPDWYFVGDE